jgi:hypothetical protein
MNGTLEETVIMGAMVIGLGSLWAFAIGGMVHMVWEATIEPLIERLSRRKR